MSLDTSEAISIDRQNASNGTAARHPDTAASAAKTRQASPDQTAGELMIGQQEWQQLRDKISTAGAKHSPAAVLGAGPAATGRAYRWGVAASLAGPCDRLTEVLSRLAVDESPKKPQLAAVDLPHSAELFIDAARASQLSAPQSVTGQSSGALLWAAALPALTRHLSHPLWCDLLKTLQQLRETTLQHAQPESPAHLIVAGEIGLTLAWRSSVLSSCKRLGKSSADAVSDWLKAEEDALSAAVVGATDARLVLASLVRCRWIIEATTKRKFKKRQLEIAAELATWIASMTVHDGTTAFSSASKSAVRDDLGQDGLLFQAVAFDPESLRPATEAALGQGHSGGRLAWEVSLPESLRHSEDAGLAMMLPEWDVRRGRTHLDYRGEDVAIELFAGRSRVIAGTWQVMIEVDGEEQHACGAWENSCEYSDDDVHYLEIEQAWTGGLTLQRQCLLIRDDRCVLLADTVIPSDDVSVQTDHASLSNAHAALSSNHAAGENGDASAGPRQPASIRYLSRIPLSGSVGFDPEAETREGFLGDSKRRALLMPLAASEWRVGPTMATLSGSADQHLVYEIQGSGRLYAPLWIDAQTRRFRRKRTWRQLTVADELRIVQPHEAAAYRVQSGSEQWFIYRSLGQRRCRTVLGKHLIADFYAGRFDTGDGSMEELVTVDDNQSDD